MKPNRAVAIIGGIGSGKSTVLNMLAELGAHTLSADAINRELLNTPTYIDGLRELFPQCIINGIVDRAQLRQLVFNDKEALSVLNNYAHPRILAKIKEEIANIKGDVFVEMPLLLESNAIELFTDVWVVVSNNAQVNAAIRDNQNVENIARVAKTQSNNQDRLKVASVIIDNNGSIDQLKDNVKQVYLRFLNEK